MKIVYIPLILLFSCGFLAFQKEEPKSIIYRDSLGRVIKIISGKVYHRYDTLGRRIEAWGNPMAIDFNSYFHTLISYKLNLIIVKEFYLSDTNLTGNIEDTANYFLSEYSLNKKGKCANVKHYKPVYDSNKKVIGRLKTEEKNNIIFDVKSFYSLPRNLRKRK